MSKLPSASSAGFPALLSHGNVFSPMSLALAGKQGTRAGQSTHTLVYLFKGLQRREDLVAKVVTPCLGACQWRIAHQVLGTAHHHPVLVVKTIYLIFDRVNATVHWVAILARRRVLGDDDDAGEEERDEGGDLHGG